MQKQLTKLQDAQIGTLCAGFRLCKKEYVPSKSADLYTLRHEKTGTELLYFARADENKTFAIGFKTLPENDTGVFHILEHSVLNGSRKYPVKEPFVSLLQSSMQTFLNAMTFSDKTLFPVSSRNHQDFFNLMSVYLDAVFRPLIYDRPEIFMQEGWHYAFDEDGTPYYNGVVFSEMKGAYADVDRVIDDEMNRLLFPDNCYGYVSGGHPDHIPALSYEQFIETHQRFYHPSNAKIFLDGQMDVDAVLRFIDEEYLSDYDYRAPDFDFVLQEPRTGENTVYYEAQPGEETLCHMACAKLLCTHRDVETLYAANVLADYLTGSNEAPLKRRFLEQGYGQDLSLVVGEATFQPTIGLLVRNTSQELFPAIKTFLPEAVRDIASRGLDKEALSASIQHLAFSNKEITEPYGVELSMKALEGWLYGDDPLTHIETDSIFEGLLQKVSTDYFENLLLSLLGDPDDKCYLYALPSLTKGQEDAQKEAQRVNAIAATWDEDTRKAQMSAFEAMQQWQQSTDSEEALATLPHLNLSDIPEETPATPTNLSTVSDCTVLESVTETGGIVYLNLFFALPDFSTEELRMVNMLSSLFGKLPTGSSSAHALETKIKATLGSLTARLAMIAAPGALEQCTPYLTVCVSMLEENVPKAMALLRELLMEGKYDETDRIYETVQQNDYYLKQILIGNGHMFAMNKVIAPYSAEGAMKEALAGDAYIRWHNTFAEGFMENAAAHTRCLSDLAKKAFVKSRLFVGYSGKLSHEALSSLMDALPVGVIGAPADAPSFAPGSSSIEIPASVGFSAMGHNLYALGGQFTGACSVLSSLMTYSYLWNMVRVQGGAYGTGMNIRANGDIYCYSYRDPNLSGTRQVFSTLSDYLKEAMEQGMPLDDIIISTVNTTDPLLDPSGVCDLACTRYLKGIPPQTIAQIRREILTTTPEKLLALTELLEAYQRLGSFCAVGDASSTAFIEKT